MTCPTPRHPNLPTSCGRRCAIVSERRSDPADELAEGWSGKRSRGIVWWRSAGRTENCSRSTAFVCTLAGRWARGAVRFDSDLSVARLQYDVRTGRTCLNERICTQRFPIRVEPSGFVSVGLD